MTREQALEQARIAVCGERQQDYGAPEDNFSIIADLWMIYLGDKCCSPDADVFILPEDVAMMMVLFKTARLITGTAKEDSFVDLIGYAACAAEIATKRDADPGIKEAAEQFKNSIYEWCSGMQTQYADEGDQ